MRVCVQQEQKFLVTTERALWRYDNAFIFTNQSEVDFGITLVYIIHIYSIFLNAACRSEFLFSVLNPRVAEVITSQELPIQANELCHLMFNYLYSDTSANE